MIVKFAGWVLEWGSGRPSGRLQASGREEDECIALRGVGQATNKVNCDASSFPNIYR